MSAPTWHGYLENFVIGEENSAVNDLSKGLLENDFKLLDLVESLGPYLTNTEKHKRCRGTQLLSEVLHRLPNGYLSQKEVGVLGTFYCDRLKDHHSVTPHVLYGMAALSGVSDIDDDQVVQIVQNIFKEVHVQSLAQGDRRYVFTVLYNFLNSKLQVLQQLGGDFVFGYIQAMDGEKDPRNLIVCFQSVRIIAQNFKIDICTEDLFEVAACYFPIDFSPPPNDPFGISKEELILDLRSCLCSSPQFAEFCLPLLIEKLTSAIPSAKVDSLQTLAACSEVYSTQSLKEYMGSFLFSIKREVFSASSDVMEGPALAAVTALARAFSTPLSQKENFSILEEFINDIYTECKRHLCEPEMKLMYPSASLLQAAAGASDASCRLVLDQVLPLLITQFSSHPQANTRTTIVDIILSFIRISINQTLTEKACGSVCSHKDTLYPMFVTLLSDPSPRLRCLGMQGVVLAVKVPGMLGNDQVSQATQHLSNILMNERDKNTRKEAVNSLTSLSSMHPNLINKIIVPPLISQLHAESMEVDNKQVAALGKADNQQVAALGKADILTTLSSLSTHHQIVQSIVPQLLQYIQKLCHRPFCDETLQETKATCSCLHKVTYKNRQNSQSVDYFTSYLIPKCFTLAIEGATSKDNNCVLSDRDVIEHLGAIIRVSVQSSQNSSEIMSGILQLYLEGKSSTVQDVTLESSFEPLKVDSDWRETQLISLLVSVICSTHSMKKTEEIDSLLEHLEKIALISFHDVTHLAACKCLAGVINKMQPDEEVNTLISAFQIRLSSILDSAACDSSQKYRALTLWVWVSKAVILRGHASQNVFIQRIIQTLSERSLASIAADGFRIILEEFEDIMSTEMHATIRIMYRQRFFLQTITAVIEGFHGAAEDMKQYYLLALSHHLRFIPKQVLLTELPKLLPLLVQSLACSEVNLHLATMTTLADLLQHDPLLLTSHIDDIIPQILTLTKYKPKMKVRIAAVKCAGLMTLLPAPLVARHQTSVVKALAAVLDDPKRMVRSEAVQARNEWFLLDTRK